MLKRSVYIFIAYVLVGLLLACGKEEKIDIQEVLNNGDLALEHYEYDLAADYYIQVLDCESDNLSARYGLEEVFKNSLITKQYDVSQKVYSYIYNLSSKGDSLSKLQTMIKDHDFLIMDDLQMALADAFFSDKNGGMKNVSNVDMVLEDFLNEYDSGFKSEFLIYYQDIDNLGTDILYYDSFGNITNNCEVHILLCDVTSNNWDAGLYIKDTEGYSQGEPISYGSFDSLYLNYNNFLPSGDSELIDNAMSISNAAQGTKYIRFDKDSALTGQNKEAYDIDNRYYMVMNNDKVLPVNLIGCVVYCLMDDTYYVVNSSMSDGEYETYEVESVDYNQVEYYLQKYTANWGFMSE